jgi:hypothetical protein
MVASDASQNGIPNVESTLYWISAFTSSHALLCEFSMWILCPGTPEAKSFKHGKQTLGILDF